MYTYLFFAHFAFGCGYCFDKEKVRLRRIMLTTIQRFKDLFILSPSWGYGGLLKQNINSRNTFVRRALRTTEYITNFKMGYSDTGHYKTPPHIINLQSFSCVLRLAKKSLRKSKTGLADVNLLGIN